MQYDRIKLQSEARAGSPRKAFTLVEMLVAVGAVALVSVGLAAVFQTVGRTVTTGKRISALTQQAAVLESQMREDFKHMTREGFLVIRHQFTMARQGNGPGITGVTRFAGDPLPARPRRIDEILFFANGEFRTAREDLVPGRTATSRAARIYYGHGQKAGVMTPTQQQNNQTDIHYSNPFFADWFDDSQEPSTRLGEQKLNPQPRFENRYANTWNLVRHAMLLVRPTSSTDGGWPQDRPRPNYQGDQYAAPGTALNNLSSDSTFQIAGQPAANSIFRTMNEMLPMVDQQYGKNAARGFSMFWDRDPSSGGDFNVQGITPRAISGVVDIAATDLDEIALVVNGSYYSPSDKPTGLSFFGPRKTTGVGVLEPPLPLMSGPWMTNTGQTQPAFYSTSYVVPVVPNTPSALNTTAARMQSWMINAMPAPSGYHPTIYAQDIKPINNGDGLSGRVGYRIRCEDELPDVRGTLDRFNNRAVQTKRNDLLAAGLSKIASRCSEFIVEWSFGQTYPAGLPDVVDPETGKTVNFSNRTIWYGRTLNAGSGTPGVYHYQLPGSTDKKAQFPDSQLSQIDLSFKPYKGNPEFAGITKIDDYIVPEWLVHGVYKWRPGGLDQSSLISYFGYFDPTYTQDDVTQPPSIPWAWPRMIRVTLTLADASDPSLEQTFQYVFDLPPDPKP